MLFIPYRHRIRSINQGSSDDQTVIVIWFWMQSLIEKHRFMCSGRFSELKREQETFYPLFFFFFCCSRDLSIRKVLDHSCPLKSDVLCQSLYSKMCRKKLWKTAIFYIYLTVIFLSGLKIYVKEATEKHKKVMFVI